ncbi:MAG: hypothetical protein U9Q84_09750, partial [Thermodesulfobacteriota bacterium]|nr:hypothetical protein [Thermodesulfobacteriota bacterium]
MKQLVTLLKPRLWSFNNQKIGKKNRIKYFLFAGIGIIFWSGIFTVSYRVLTYFKQNEDIGDILSDKLLSMVMLTFFSLLIFSSILTSLSKLYLSKDLPLVHSMPVQRGKIFLARWIESTIDSSWMLIAYTVPVFLAYGMVYKATPFFYANIILVLLLLCIIASALSALMVLLTVSLVPANKIRNIFVFLGLAVLIILYLTFRLLKPERLVNPETFSSVLLYVQGL